MKNSLLSRLSFLLILLALSIAHAHAQLAPAAGVPAAQPGYWNVETNLTTRDYTIVRFFDGQDQLVSEERLDNVSLDLTRRTHACRRAKRQLNQALLQVLRAPAAAAQTTAALAQELGRPQPPKQGYAAQ